MKVTARFTPVPHPLPDRLYTFRQEVTKNARIVTTRPNFSRRQQQLKIRVAGINTRRGSRESLHTAPCHRCSGITNRMSIELGNNHVDRQVLSGGNQLCEVLLELLIATITSRI